jgi:tetratricopeptide (TPR) repeat protein
VAEWIEQHRNALQVRTRIGYDAERWAAAGRPRDLLLPRGSQVNQARALLDLDGFTLAPQEQEYVRVSVQRVKLAERIKVAMMAGVTMLAVLAVILGLAARNAERDAEQQRTEAEGLMSYMLGEFVEKLRPLGRLDLLDGISGKALAYLSSAQSTDVSPTTLSQRAKALHVIAEVNIARSNFAKATEALQAAHTILLQLEHTNSDRKVLYKTLGANAFYQGQIHILRGELELAKQQFTEYRVHSDSLAATDPDDSDGWMEQSYANSNLGAVALSAGRYAAAADAFAASVQLKQRALTARPGNTKLSADLSNTLSWLAEAKAKQGLLGEAMALYQREEELLRPLHSAAPNDALWSYRMANALTYQGELKLALGSPAEARGNLLKAESLLLEVVKQDPSNRQWQTGLYTVQSKLFDLDSELGKPAEALPRQVALLDKLAGLRSTDGKPAPASLQQLIAAAQQSLATTQLKLGHWADARRQLADSTAVLERLYANSKSAALAAPRLASGLLIQAQLERATGNAEAAQRACVQAQQVLAGRAEQSDDFALLAPHVRAHLCTGDQAHVAMQQGRLERMAYKETYYMQALGAASARPGRP